MEEDIPQLRSSEAVRQRRLNMVRTPTAVVSEVFGFLNEVSSVTVDDDDELTMSDGEVDRLFSDLDIEVKDNDEADAEDCVNESLLFCSNDREKFLAEYKSKDSGFASLERQRCEPSSLYDSFVETEDDTEDAIDSVSSNDITRSISESLYDDMDISSVPRSISMEAKSTKVDDEIENAIALSAEKFGIETENIEPCMQTTSLSGDETHVENVSAECHKTSKKGGNITVIMVKKPTFGEDCVSCDKPLANFQTDMSTMVTSEGNSDVEFSEKEKDNGSMVVTFVNMIPSSISQQKKSANVFDFVINSGQNNIDSHMVQSGIDAIYSNGIKIVSSGSSFDFCEQEPDSSIKGIYDGDKRATREENNDVSAALSPTSSDDGNDDNEDDIVRDYDYSASISDSAYDTIDMESRDNGFNNKASDSVVSFNYKGEDVIESSSLKETDAESKVQTTTPVTEKSPVNAVRRHKLEKNPSAEMVSDDSSDEDVGVYAESFRRSNWVRLSQQEKLDVKMPDQSSPKSAVFPLMLTPNNIGSSCTDSIDGEIPFSPPADEVFIESLSETSRVKAIHKRTDSMTTTASETEFKCQYVSRRKCLIQRADSQQEYHRLSSRVYDQDKQVIVQRTSDSEDLGLHILDSHPAFITSVDPGSAAEKAGITEGQILVSVNDQNVLTTSHTDIVELIHSLKGTIKLGVANSDFQPVRDLQATVMSGHMSKLGNFGFKLWKKRYFILRQDNCLYYYKNEQESDPLGAIPLGGYTISRHTETSKDFCFKAEKYGGRTYYFIADNRDQMTAWVGALTEAAARSKKRKEAFLSVSSHNVGLPALHILKPECAGFLGKLSPSKRSWRRRYCVLKDACVYYYKDKNAVSALGVAHLHGYTVDVENFQRKKFSFSLQPPDKKLRIFYFCADNETDKKRWVESLIHSIQRWVRVDKEAEC